MRNKSGAMEMSIGTIVVIVLSMTMLIGGIVLVTNILGGATNLVDLNNEQISSEIAKLYGDDKKLVIYPSVDIFEVKIKESTAFAIRIKNTLGGAEATQAVFSYEIKPDNFEDCGLTEAQILGWMKGSTGDGIRILPGEEDVEKVLLEVPEGSPLCSFKVRVTAYQKSGPDSEEQPYAIEQMFIKIKE